LPVLLRALPTCRSRPLVERGVPDPRGTGPECEHRRGRPRRLSLGARNASAPSRVMLAKMDLRPRANPISLGALLGFINTVVIAIGMSAEDSHDRIGAVLL